MIRRARFDDAACVLVIRNEPDVREASLDTHEITGEEHRRWWLSGGMRQTWIIEDDRICPLGYVRVSPAGVVSIAVATWARGRGVGARALEEIMAIHGYLRADIRADNEASRRLFEWCGFRVVGATSVRDPLVPYGFYRYEWSVN